MFGTAQGKQNNKLLPYFVVKYQLKLYSKTKMPLKEMPLILTIGEITIGTV